MPRSNKQNAIRLRGVRHNNLKGFDLDVPTGKLVVVTGLSGSGKSSLAFDTLYAEGQRRYIETFSPYARQFFDRMDKPQVDSIENIPPAIAIEQRNAVRSTRSTVGTMTEICDHIKVLWPHIAQLHCRQCDQPVSKESPQSVWKAVNAKRRDQSADVLITFNLPLSEKLSLDESLTLIAKQGYQRILINGAPVRIDDALAQSSIVSRHSAITVVQDRVRLTPARRSRFIEACEQAYHFGKGKLTIHPADVSSPRSALRTPRSFSAGLHCARCDLDYRDPSPALFSFNHPVGACPACKGFGRIITIDYDLALPDRHKTLKQGAVKPWQTGMSADCQRDLLKFCRATHIPTNVPFQDLSKEHQDWVIQGDPEYGTDEEHEWPRAWYGIKGYFRWLESKAYKMHVRVLLSRYRAYTPCPDCNGARLNADALLYHLRADISPRTPPKKSSAPNHIGGYDQLSLAEFYALPIGKALNLINDLIARTRRRNSAIDHALQEVHARLRYLNDIGLGYITLDRATRTLSGGETERVNLATCLGTRLVNTLFVLDEPSVGLHPRDTDRLVDILRSLRDEGNTVVVVEHERSVMQAADQIIDLGPGHGSTGGQLVFQGSYAKILTSSTSLTGKYLSGKTDIDIPERRPIKVGQASSLSSKVKTLKLTHATRHNLKDLNVEIPLNRFVCISGVSGSGKSTLISDVLLPALQQQIGAAPDTTKASDRIGGSAGTKSEDSGGSGTSHLTGTEHLTNVVLVDQSSLGKTPRSNPAVYTGAFDHIRDLFALSEAARQHGLNASAFSFNSAQGQCERCRGAGFEKVEMQFLSDVFIRCPDCDGRRYREHILEVRIQNAKRSLSIADILESTVDEAVAFLEAFAESKQARRAISSLKLLQEVGLGYLQLGQPINTLSGGESQRLKLVKHLANASPHSAGISPAPPTPGKPGSQDGCATLFLLDEPTTGLHFDDVRILLKALQRLVDAGHSLIVIEHNLDVLKCADWIVDLGPDAGANGGQLVIAGTPETVAACKSSHTGVFLKAELGAQSTTARGIPR